MHEPGSTPPPKLSAEEREALYREYDEWVRAARSGGGRKSVTSPSQARMMILIRMTTVPAPSATVPYRRANG